MNYTHYRIAQDYMRETHAQAYCDYLARSLRPSFRQNVAKFFTTLALQPHSQPAQVVSLQN